MGELELIGELLKVGVSTGICAYGWWKADKRADTAQNLADSRGDAYAQALANQAEQAAKTTSAMALQNLVLDRVSATIDRVEPVLSLIRRRDGLE